MSAVMVIRRVRLSIGMTLTCLVLFSLTACGTPQQAGLPRAASETIPDRPSPESMAPPFNFDNPIGGILVSTPAEAQARADFPVLQPKNLGTPKTILVSDQALAKSVAFVYDHPEFGRIAVVESTWSFDRPRFEAMIDDLLAQNDAPGVSGRAEEVTIRGQRAMLNKTTWGHLLLDFLEGPLEIGVHGRDATKGELLQIGEGL